MAVQIDDEREADGGQCDAAPGAVPPPVPTLLGSMHAAGGTSSSRDGRGGELDITSFIKGSTFMITGVSGFMGTFLVISSALIVRLNFGTRFCVEKILREAPEGTRIYVPIRDAPSMSFEDRFWKKVLPRDFFNKLREEKGDGFEDFIRAHLIPLRGDLDKPLLGFPPDLVAKLQDEVEVVVHCAANTGFHVPLDEIVATNVRGWMQVLEIAQGCKNIKVCSTISTAYVHGFRTGLLPETPLDPEQPPSCFAPLAHSAKKHSSTGKENGTAIISNGDGSANGHANGLSNGHSNGLTKGQSNDHSNGLTNEHSNGHTYGHSHGSCKMNGHNGAKGSTAAGHTLDLETELLHAEEATAMAHQQAETSGLQGRDLRKHLRSLLTAAGKQRARMFGWNDSYTYSKALAEVAAVRAAQEYGLPMVLLRPTIVESAMQEPSPGIIDSIACMEPLIFAIGRGAMDGFPADVTRPLDIVPVDIATNGILGALAASAGNQGTHVYQIGSSHCNPMEMPMLIDTLFSYFQKYPMRDEITGDIYVPEEPPRPYPDVDSFIAALEARHEAILEDVDTSSPDGRQMEEGLARSRKFIRFLAEIYHPYTNYEGVFVADNLLALWGRLSLGEQQRYPFALDRIPWREYLWNTHLPGIRKYLLDENEEDWKLTNDSTLSVGRNF